MTKKEDIDDKLTKWNEIFDELTLDAKDLIKDIKDMISYIAISAGLMLMIGIAAVAIAFLRQMEPKYLASSIIIFSICAGNAYMLMRKWLKLRIRYDKLNSIKNEISTN